MAEFGSRMTSRDFYNGYGDDPTAGGIGTGGRTDIDIYGRPIVAPTNTNGSTSGVAVAQSTGGNNANTIWYILAAAVVLGALLLKKKRRA